MELPAASVVPSQKVAELRRNYIVRVQNAAFLSSILNLRPSFGRLRPYSIRHGQCARLSIDASDDPMDVRKG